jgi:hypothetical protein
MNQFLCLVGLLSTSLCWLLSTGCNASAQDDKISTGTNVAIQATQPDLLDKDDLLLMPALNRNRQLTTAISGRVIPASAIQLSAEVQGTVEPQGRGFKPGIDFNRGATLIKLDDTEFKLNLASQRAAFLNVLTGILPDLKSDYPDSYPKWFDYVEAYDFDDALEALPEPASSEERFFLTTNQVYTLYFQIKSLEEHLTKYRIVAPFAGTITASNIEFGSLVTPGQALGTIADRVHFELEAGIPLKVANELEMGEQVRFTSHEVAGEWTGRVVRINNLVDPSTQNIPVYFSLTGKNLRAGMYLESSMSVNTLEKVTTIPNSAMNRDESVLILAGSLIIRKDVRPLDFLSDSIVVKGLADDDLLILNQFEVPVVGSKVKI